MKKSTEDLRPLLSQDELDALTNDTKQNRCDKDYFFLLKLQLAICICMYFIFQMLFFPENVNFWLSFSQSNPERAVALVRTRGVIVLFYMVCAIVAWKHNKHAELVFGSAAVIATLNFVLDLPHIWAADFENNMIAMPAVLVLRILVIVLLASLYRNLPRSVYLKGRILTNPFKVKR